MLSKKEKFEMGALIRRDLVMKKYGHLFSHCITFIKLGGYDYPYVDGMEFKVIDYEMYCSDFWNRDNRTHFNEATYKPGVII